MNSTLFKN